MASASSQNSCSNSSYTFNLITPALQAVMTAACLSMIRVGKLTACICSGTSAAAWAATSCAYGVHGKCKPPPVGRCAITHLDASWMPVCLLLSVTVLRRTGCITYVWHWVYVAPRSIMVYCGVLGARSCCIETLLSIHMPGTHTSNSAAVCSSSCSSECL